MKQVGDEPLAIGEAIKSCLSKVDVVMTTGGVSVGKRDFLHTVMPKMGAKKLFWRVNIQPGTPVLASVYQEKIILSLSGNPFAALVNFELLAKPLLSHMMGQGSGYDKKRAKLTTNFLKIPKRRRFLRGFYEDGHVSLPTAVHASSVLSSMANCNCLIDIKAGTTGLACGDEVEVLMI
jgi:molybdopterin molybdotransferase